MNPVDVSICTTDLEFAFDFLKTCHCSVIHEIPGLLDLEEPDKLDNMVQS
jgi:hypothetical protein